MIVAQDDTPSTRRYFVDEAGDGILFNRKKQIIIGKEGCSKFFILGFADIPNPSAIEQDLANLRTTLLRDPYFRQVPSMQPAQGKTALFFHAKDDIPEVRWQVFTRLQKYQEIRFFAIVRDKRQVLAYVRQHNEQDAQYRYSPNEQYDFLVQQLFKNMLHKQDGYQIFFAKRGAADRTAALQQALEAARTKFRQRWGIVSNSTITVTPCAPQTTLGLQVTDYFLWALQRFYEQGEDRYLNFLQPSIAYVHDFDDVRGAPYGAYYTRKKPLTLAALAGRT